MPCGVYEDVLEIIALVPEDFVYGQTEFVGLKIFFQAFGYLRFGVATAMAWILGSMLVGFTVIQLQKLSRMEFKTAAGIK